MRTKRSLKAAAGAVLLAGATALALAGTAPAKAATAASGNFTGTLANGTTWVADVPANWNGTLLLYSHGFGPLTAADAPDPVTQAALLARGYALAGSSDDPNGSEWALDTAVSDQFGTLAAVEGTVLPRRPSQLLAFGTSMGGLVSALEAQDGTGRINGALTTCGIVAGGLSCPPSSASPPDWVTVASGSRPKTLVSRPVIRLLKSTGCVVRPGPPGNRP